MGRSGLQHRRRGGRRTGLQRPPPHAARGQRRRAARPGRTRARRARPNYAPSGPHGRRRHRRGPQRHRRCPGRRRHVLPHTGAPRELRPMRRPPHRARGRAHRRPERPQRRVLGHREPLSPDDVGRRCVRGVAQLDARRSRPTRAGGARGLGHRAARGRGVRAPASGPGTGARARRFPAGLRPARRRAGAVAGTRMADATEERRWERERTSELAFMAARLRELESAS